MDNADYLGQKYLMKESAVWRIHADPDQAHFLIQIRRQYQGWAEIMHCLQKSAKIWKFNEYLLMLLSESHISLTFQWYSYMTFTPPHQQIFIELSIFGDFFQWLCKQVKNIRFDVLNNHFCKPTVFVSFEKGILVTTVPHTVPKVIVFPRYM